jgi:hypothetical protein
MLHEVIRNQCVDGVNVLLVNVLIGKAPDEQLVLITGHLAISSRGAETLRALTLEAIHGFGQALRPTVE